MRGLVPKFIMLICLLHINFRPFDPCERVLTAPFMQLGSLRGGAVYFFGNFTKLEVTCISTSEKNCIVFFPHNTKVHPRPLENKTSHWIVLWWYQTCRKVLRLVYSLVPPAAPDLATKNSAEKCSVWGHLDPGHSKEVRIISCSTCHSLNSNVYFYSQSLSRNLHFG